MGGRAGNQMTNSSTTNLPGNQQSNVDTLMAGARDLYNSGGPQYYGGQTYAPTNANQQAGRDAAISYSGGVGNNLVNSAVKNDTSWLNSNPMAVQNTPGYAGVRSGIINDVTKNLTNNILPNIRSGSAATGGLGGSRQGLIEANAIGQTNQNLGTSLANLDMGIYGQNLNQINAAANRAGSDYQLGLMPSQTQQAVGAQQQADVQKGIDENVARWNFNQIAPQLNLQNLQQFTGTAGQYGGTQYGQQQGGLSGGGNGLLGGIGALLTGIGALYN